MLRQSIALAITAFWALMMGLLVRREILPGFEAHAPVRYGSLLSSEQDSRADRMGIFIAGRRVGTTVTSLRREPSGAIRISNQTDLDLARIKALRRPGITSITTHLVALADPARGLRSFKFEVDWDVVPVRIRGVVQGETLRMRKQIGDAPAQSVTVLIDPKTLVSSGFSPILGSSTLTVGKRWDIATFNPLTLRMDKATAEVTAKESLEIDGRKVDTRVVAIRYGPIETRSWVADDGQVVRQEAPFGILLQRESAETLRD